MSFIRGLEKGEWEEVGTGHYCYGGKDNGLHGVPRKTLPFIEVVMRMLDQSDELDEETLEAVHAALRSRLRVEEGSPGRIRTEQPHYGVGDE